jgi:hypothetical protein
VKKINKIIKILSLITRADDLKASINGFCVGRGVFSVMGARGHNLVPCPTLRHGGPGLNSSACELIVLFSLELCQMKVIFISHLDEKNIIVRFHCTC